MRRQIRPFTVERKRSGRQAGTEAMLPDPPVSSPEPMPVKTFDAPRETPRDAPRWAAAEALFSTPAPEARKESTGAADSPASTGRILQSLVEPPAPAPAYAVEDAPGSYSGMDAPKRRGRKPGSRNKTAQARNPAKGDEQGPKTIDHVMRNLFEFWADEDEQPAEAQAAPQTAPLAAPGAPQVAAPASPVARDAAAEPLRSPRRGRALREEFPRGQRWKARLPRFAR